MAAISDGCSSCQERAGVDEQRTLPKQIKTFLEATWVAKMQAMPREDVIKIQLQAPASLNARFTLMLELYKMKIEACKQAGYSVRDLDALLEKIGNEKSEDGAIQVFDQTPLPLKELLFLTQGAEHFAEKCNLSDRFQSPFFQLAQVEKEMDFPFGKLNLLISEVHLDIKLFGSVPNQIAAAFYHKTLFPNFVKVMETLELEKETSKAQAVFNMYLACFHPYCFNTFNRDGVEDPLIAALPYIAKYGSLNDIEPYFNEKYKEAKAWDKTYAWIDLHCRCASILAESDKAKAQGYLDQAKRLLQEKLTFTLSPFTYYEIAKVREKAQERIADLKLKAG